jgi:hypothetical protein
MAQDSTEAMLNPFQRFVMAGLDRAIHAAARNRARFIPVLDPVTGDDGTEVMASGGRLLAPENLP